MKIGVDLRALEGGAQHRGIGRYATELIEEFGRIDSTNEYVFYASSKSVELPKFRLPKSFKYQYSFGKGPGFRRTAKFLRTVHVTPEPLRIDKDKLNVFFQLDIQQPIIAKKTPIVPVLYDLIPFLYKDIYQKIGKTGISLNSALFQFKHRYKWYLSEKTITKYKQSAAVISISEYSRQDLIKFLPGIDADKIHAIPLAAGRPPKSDKLASNKFKKMGIKNFLFYVGGADPRKGLVNFVKNMEQVWEKYPDIQVVMAGKEVTHPDVPEARSLAEQAKKSSRPKQIILLGFISDGELAWLYSNARAFVFPSIYEGFGLPVLEAMQAGCPVVAYNNTSIPEVADNAAILVEDGESMSPAINKLLSDNFAHDKLVRAGKKQAAKFTWEKTASSTLEVLEKVGTRNEARN